MPLPVVTVVEMRDWENQTWASGVTPAEVISRVGQAVAAEALNQTQIGDAIAIFAGKGNNGADALACASHLSDRTADIFKIEDPSRGMAEFLAALALRRKSGKRPYALIVDGLFGIGLNRPLDSDWQQLIAAINETGTKVLSIDVPSGLNADTGETYGAALKAFVTLTIGAPKRGLLASGGSVFTGRIKVADQAGLLDHAIALREPRELAWSTGSDFINFPPARPAESHKGTFGHLLIIAGSQGYHGAAVLAARGAQRAQPGLVTLWTLENVYAPIASQLQAVMVDTWRPGKTIPESCTAVLFGPGLVDVPSQLKDWLAEVWLKSKLSVVADASGLDWLSSSSASVSPRILTPHPGEAARLLKVSSQEIQADRCAALRDLSKRYGGAWIVLKGHQTLVGRTEGRITVNGSGNPGLAQGGTGDLLAGFAAGLVAQPLLQNDLQHALAYAVWEHGCAADRLAGSRRHWVVEDLCAELGEA